MINRSLIRIKTIQILYSYLLTRSDFKLAPAPNATDASRDRQFAYSVYLDLLVLILKLSSIPLGPKGGVLLMPDPGLKKNRVGHAIASAPAVMSVLQENPERLTMFDSSLKDIAEGLAATPAYRDYKRKRKLRMSDDVAFWNFVLTDIFRKSKTVERVLRRDEMFSHLGFDNGVNMLVQTLTGFDDTRASYSKAREDLDLSLRKAYDLYHALLVLPVAITDIHNQRLERNRQKYRPTEEDLNPNMRLTDNLFVAALRSCRPLAEYIEENPDADPAQWRDFDSAAGRMLDSILGSQLYADYLASEPGDYATDAAFWRDALRTIVFPSDELAEALETQSVYWNDDMAIMSTFALKTIRRSYADSKAASDDESDAPEENEADIPAHYGKVDLLPMFMNEADERFGAELFELVVGNREEYRSYIDRFINPAVWDTERLAFMDIVVMMTAIAEIINFPSIPIPVTMNEYIEIANDYSTPRSGQFINGILSSVAQYLQQEKIIDKL